MKTVKRLRTRENFSESFKRKLCGFNAKCLPTKLSLCVIFCVFIRVVWMLTFLLTVNNFLFLNHDLGFMLEI